MRNLNTRWSAIWPLTCGNVLWGPGGKPGPVNPGKVLPLARNLGKVGCMGKKGRRQRTPAAPVARQETATVTELRPSGIPRALQGLDPATRAKVQLLLDLSADLAELEANQAKMIGALRRAGISWDSLGWCIGTTGEAVRQRFGGSR